MVTSSEPPRSKDDPIPLAIGTRVNLRRQMPEQAEEDQGWTVTGYTLKREDKWLGYELTKEDGRITSAAKSEAMDVVGS